MTSIDDDDGGAYVTGAALRRARACVDALQGIPDPSAWVEAVRGRYGLAEACARVLSLIDSGDWPLPDGFHESDVTWLRTALGGVRC